MTITPLKALDLDQLRQRSSTKWRTYDDDVIPLFVAETDFPLPPLVSERLSRAVSIGDTGYTPPNPGVKEAFIAYADRHWGWSLKAKNIRTTCDVMMGVVEILRRVISPGDGVIINSPVYPPFRDCIEEAGGVVVDVPLRVAESGWELDLPGIERALAAGAKAVLLCNPHNPTGTIHTRDSLRELGNLAFHAGATVISDEIHAPLCYEPGSFTPFLTASPSAVKQGFTVTSASKAYNLAGLKCALMVAHTNSQGAVLRALPSEIEWRTGLFGALAAVAAFDERSDAWLESEMLALGHNRKLLAQLLTEYIPSAKYQLPEAGYLAWVDLGDLLGDNPAEVILREAKVALSQGPTFGESGKGHIRINLGCAPELLEEAVKRIAAVIAA